MGVTVTGEGRALNSLRGGRGRYQAGVVSGMHRAGPILEMTAKREILNGSKSGQMYGSHQASAPGEYSAFLGGQHYNSIGYAVEGPRQMAFGANAPHSVFLELGTSKMAPRDDLGKTVKSEQRSVGNILGRSVLRKLVV